MRTATRMVVLGRKLWTPAALDSSLALWLDADDFSTITLNGSTVSQWSDKSGNGRHASQVNPQNQPTYTASGLNGKSVLTFDGSDDWLEIPNSVASSGANVIFASCTPNHTTTSSSLIIGRAYNWGSWQLVSTNFGEGVRFGVGRAGIDEAQASVIGLTNSTNKILTGVYDKTNIRLSVNGGTFTSNAYTPDILYSSYDAGSIGTFRDVFGNTASFYRGLMHEILVMHSGPSQDQIDRVQGYLAHKRGLIANLPIDHPFKFTPPYI